MQIEVQQNPNCGASEQFVFCELEPSRFVNGIRVEERGKEMICDVVGVEEGGGWSPGRAAKITDSGAGYAYVIYGGAWGIRLRPETYAHESWDLNNKHQWGEPFKIYGDEKDIVYADAVRWARTVVFDGECGFCQRSIRLGKMFDWLHRIDWRARLEPGLKEEYPRLSDEDTQNRMISIRADGKTYGGFYAVRDIMLQFPLTFLPALLLYIPGMSLIGVPVYKWIAKNRHRFGSHSCEIKQAR